MATSHPSKQQIKYKKIVLTGLQIPQPPPSLQTLSQPHQKQQQIQNSSSSSEQQVYYQNYFQNKLNNIIEGLLKQIELGNKIPWEILQVNQNQQIKGQHQYVDVVLKVAVNTQQSLRLNENIQKIKAANKQLIKQKQRLNKNFKKKKQVYQNSTKIVQKAQKKLKKVKKQQKLKSDHKIKELDSDRFIMQETSQDLNQMVSNSSHIVQINQKNYQQAKTNHNIKSNVTNESQSQLQQQNQEQNTQQSNDSKDQLNNIQIPQKSNKLCLILIVILIVSVVVGTRIYLSSLDVNQMTKQTLQNPAIKKDSSDNYGRQNGDIIYYFGEISAIAKKQNYFIPLQIKDQNLKIPLYIQMLPKVNKPQESLHPRNLSYIRPTLTQILSFPHIYFNQSIKNSTDFAHKILDIDEAENKKIDGYLKSLGKTEQEIMINLYTQMHKNPNSSFLLQAQYIYLSTKYQTLANISKSIQKPLCIVAYSPQSLYKQQKFLPFFQSLFNQNYTNYRLLYIDDGPTDKYNNARIMNYLWDKHYYSMGNINIFNLNFVRFDEKIGKIVGIGAVVRELCADGEIVVEIDADSGFIGRQALKIISAVYDGGHQKMILGPKNQPFFNPHYQTQPNDRSTQSNLKIDESKIKKKIMFIKADDKQKSSKNKQFSQRIDNKDDDMIVIEGILRSRYVGNIWLAYSNYLQIDQQNQLIPKIDQQIKISQKQTNLNFKLINMKQVIQQNYEFISSPNIEQDLLLSKQSKSNARKLSNMCFKTYAIQLHHKLPLNSLLPKKYQSSPLFIQIQVYSYNFKQLISLLQMAGKFTTKNQPQQKKIKQKQNKIRNSQHYVQINEPLCFRTYKNKQQNDECKFKIQIFAQLSAISRDQLKQLQNLGQKSGDISKQKLQLTQKIRKNLEKLERQILQLCQL